MGPCLAGDGSLLGCVYKDYELEPALGDRRIYRGEAGMSLSKEGQTAPLAAPVSGVPSRGKFMSGLSTFSLKRSARARTSGLMPDAVPSGPQPSICLEKQSSFHPSDMC